MLISYFPRKISYVFDSVRFQLMSLYMLIMSLLLLIFCTTVYIIVARTALLGIDDGLNTTAQRLATTYLPADGLLHLPEQYTNTDNFLGPLDVALLLNPQGKIIQTFGSPTAQALEQLQRVAVSPDITSSQFSNSSLYVKKFSEQQANFADYRVFTLHILYRNQIAAILVVASPRSDEYELQVLLRGLVLGGIITLLLAAGCGYWFSARAMYPIKTITQTMHQIDENDLSRRLNLTSRGELGELAATFDHMLDRLEDAFRRINQFTTDASHELRTPLTIIDLIAKERLVQSQTSAPKEYQQALAVIQAENEHMIRMVKHLLTLSRADNGQLRLYKEEVDLSDIALDAVERLFLLANKQGIVLSVDALPEIIMSGDRVYLASMLTNLIENAIKYTSGVGDAVHVETGITHAEQEKKGWIRVKDNGPGIAAEHLPYLFDRFYRVDKARSRRSEDEAGEMNEASGSGLGLSIVAWVAQAHGGDVHVQSEVGQGSVFEVCFPLIEQCVGK